MALTYEPIASQTLGTAAANVTFSSIPNTYTDLVLVSVVRGGASNDTLGDFRITFNGDTATNYSMAWMTGDGATASTSRGTGDTAMTIGRIVRNLYPANMFSLITTNIFSYTGNTNKTVLSNSASNANGGIAEMRSVVGLWRSTSVISSLNLSSFGATFVAGSTFTLYGIKAA